MSTDLIQTESAFTNARNQSIYTLNWIPSSGVKGVLMLCHGFGEHCMRYRQVAEFFGQYGYATFTMDHHGHGRSHGERAYISRFSDFVDDFVKYMDLVLPKYTGVPRFLLGHSMGGLITFNVALRRPTDFNGIIFSAPLLMKDDSVSSATVFLAKIVDVIAPSMGVAPLDLSTLCSDPAYVKDYKEDPLVFHGQIAARTGVQLLNACEQAGKDFAKATFPFLVLQGTNDKLVNPQGAQALHKNAASTDKTIIMYPGLMHVLLNEPKAEEIKNEIWKWMQAHVPGASTQSAPEQAPPTDNNTTEPAVDNQQP